MGVAGEECLTHGICAPNDLIEPSVWSHKDVILGAMNTHTQINDSLLPTTTDIYMYTLRKHHI